MLTKCDFKMEKYACLITLSDDRPVLPGRMLRTIVANLERRYQVLEFSNVVGYREVDQMEDVVGVVELRTGFFQRLLGKHQLCVFQKPHPSFYDAQYVQLGEEEQAEFRERLPEGEELVVEDYTVSIPAHCFLAMTVDDDRMVIDILNHLKLRDFTAVREAVATLFEGVVSIFDETELLAEYIDAVVPDILSEGLDEWVNPPELVDSLNI